MYQSIDKEAWKKFKKVTRFWRIAATASREDIETETPIGQLYKAYKREETDNFNPDGSFIDEDRTELMAAIAAYCDVTGTPEEDEDEIY